MSKREADGYCAWRPEQGWFGNGLCLSRTESEAERRVIASLYCRKLETDLAACQAEFDEAGWQIRPVYLSTEPPEEAPSINAAGLHKLINWAKWMASEHSRNLKTLNCDDSLYDILEDLELLLPKSEGEKE